MKDLSKERSRLLERYNTYLEDTKVESTEEKILFEILNDIRSRRGLRQEWDDTYDVIQEEILQKWYDIITKTK